MLTIYILSSWDILVCFGDELRCWYEVGPEPLVINKVVTDSDVTPTNGRTKMGHWGYNPFTSFGIFLFM